MLRVLIAEDDVITATLAETILMNNGYDVCGTARTVAEAVDLVRRHTPHLALLDMHLADGELGTEIVAKLGKLEQLGIMYATADNSCASLSTVHGHACLAKPYTPRDLLHGFQIVSGIIAGDKISPPFPRGFTVLSSPSIAS